MRARARIGMRVLNLFDDLINGEMTLLHTVDLDCMPHLKTVFGIKEVACKESPKPLRRRLRRRRR